MLHESQCQAARLTRRELFGLLGAGAAAVALPDLAAGAKPIEFPKEAIIRTVLRDLPPESLSGGAALFHEHLSLAPDFMPRWMAYFRAQNPPRGGNGAATPPPAAPPSSEPYFMQDLDLMTDEMHAAAKDGAACIVDGWHPDMGRSLDFLKKLSTKSGMPIVASCGYYSQPFYPPEVATMTEDQIAD